VTPTARLSKAKQLREDDREEKSNFNSSLKIYMQFQQQMTKMQIQKSIGKSMMDMTFKKGASAMQQQPIY